MGYSQRNANGQALAAASAPVVLASDETVPTQGAQVGSTGSATPTKAALVGQSDGTNLQPLKTLGGTVDGTSLGVPAGAMTYNGTNWDRARGNQPAASILASAARTTTQTGSDQTNYNSRGVKVVLDVTSAGTGSVTLEIDAKDEVSGKYYPVLTGAAVTTTSTNVYTVYPGVAVVANQSASDVLPRTWRVKVTANNANSVTYSVGAALIL